MKITCLIVTLALLGTLASQANPTPQVVLDQNSYSAGVGGEFTAYTFNPSSYGVPGNYASVAQVNGGFETFCIETTVDFNPGVKYNYTLNTVDSQGRDLSLGTAYLYESFARGILTGYNYTDVSTRNTDAGLLQEAIWYLQGGQTYGGITPTTQDNPFYAQAVDLFGESVTAPNDNTYDVSIMRLTYDGQPAQNQLEYTGVQAVPEPSSWIVTSAMLLPLGVSIYRSRNKKAKA